MIADKMIRVSSKGQIVLPKRIREKMGIHEGDYIFVRESPDGLLLLGKQKESPIEPILQRFREAAKAANFTREDLEKAIAEVRESRELS